MRNTFPKPETQINVLRRYLHIIALLQKRDDTENWNASTLADLISQEESGNEPSEKAIRDYIRKYLQDELGIEIQKKKGGRKISIADMLDNDLLARVASVYAGFVVNDSTRDIIIKRLIKKHPEECLWMLARIHFAMVEKKRLAFEYMPNTERRNKSYTVNPYHLVFRNNNLYLVAKNLQNGIVSLFIVNKIENLEVRNERYSEKVPKLSGIFADTLGSFIGKKHAMRIRFTRRVLPMIDQAISVLEPKIVEIEKDEVYEARFSTTDDLYICKQLFLYGDDVEILEPREMREIMIGMLKKSMSVYERKE